MSASASLVARKLPRDSVLPTPDPPTFRSLAYALFGLTTGVLAWAAVIDGGAITRTGWRLIPWIIAVMVADLASLNTSRAGLQLSFSYPLLLAAAFVYDPTASAV